MEWFGYSFCTQISMGVYPFNSRMEWKPHGYYWKHGIMDVETGWKWRIQIIDSLSVPENSEIYDFVIHGDTLAAALGDAAFLETILSPTEIGQAIYYPEVIVGSLAYDSNRYVFGIPGEKIVLASNNDGKMRILDSVFVEDAISLVVLEMDGGFIHL